MAVLHCKLLVHVQLDLDGRLLRQKGLRRGARVRKVAVTARVGLCSAARGGDNLVTAHPPVHPDLHWLSRLTRPRASGHFHRHAAQNPAVHPNRRLTRPQLLKPAPTCSFCWTSSGVRLASLPSSTPLMRCGRASTGGEGRVYWAAHHQRAQGPLPSAARCRALPASDPGLALLAPPRSRKSLGPAGRGWRALLPPHLKVHARDLRGSPPRRTCPAPSHAKQVVNSHLPSHRAPPPGACG